MDRIPLIPRPLSASKQEGDPFVINGDTVLVNEGGAGIKELVQRGAQELSSIAGAPIRAVNSLDNAGSSAPVRLIISDHPSIPAGEEGYVVTVSNAEALLLARASKGLVRAWTTFMNLVQTTPGEEAVVNPVIVEDAPRFRWRGLTLDVARSFFPVSEVKQVVDLMARYKMNVLHLHLSDDQGWRLDIPSRPELAAIAGKTSVSGGRSGFYTVEDFNELVEYAAARGVEIVPEFDTPGHVNAATHTYGELNPDGNATQTYDGVEVGFSRLHRDVPETDRFLSDIFGDAASLAPGPYVHIGGDEVLRMESEEYADLVRAAADKVRAAGKDAVAWQEAASVEPVSVDILQFWQPTANREDVARAANAGVKVIMSPGDRAYLDMKYDDSTEYGLTWAGTVELERSYTWDPETELESLPKNAVIGVSAALWSETIHDLDSLMYMLLPRLAAIAEVAWSRQENRDWHDFSSRIAQEALWWNSKRWSWHASPGVKWPQG